VSAERSCQQASGVTLTKFCRRNNSHGDALPHHIRLAGTLTLFVGSVQSFSHFRECLGPEHPKSRMDMVANSPLIAVGHARQYRMTVAEND
jgi:hypothetical protein